MHIVFSIYALVLGLLVGSFLNVVISRMPEGRSVAYPPSHCPICGSNIRAYDNIPVLSWLILKGACRDCKSGISPLYPVMELLTGLIALLIFWKYVPSIEALNWANVSAAAYYFGFAATLIAITYIDIRHYIIPDQLSIYAIPFAVLGMLGLDYMGFVGALSWKASVLGATLGGGVLLLAAAVWWILRRTEGMGMGDVKLLALIGAVLGPWPALFFILFASSFLALFVILPLRIMRGNGFKHALPYGPFLAAAALLWILHGPYLMEFWLPGYEVIKINL
ncbi:MAG: prepilin peptidase [Proteobacteria bacterium]|nr:prepilin peptidase [Pseudomonadota bacterium]